MKLRHLPLSVEFGSPSDSAAVVPPLSGVEPSELTRHNPLELDSGPTVYPLEFERQSPRVVVMMRRSDQVMRGVGYLCRMRGVTSVSNRGNGC